MLSVHDVDLNVNLLGIMGANLGPVAIFQRCNDASTVGIVFRIRTRHHTNVQWKADPKTANLDIPLLHNVEQPHLQFFREIGQLVDAEDPPIGTGNQPVMDDQLIRQIAPFRDFNRIDFTNEFWRGDIRCGQLFSIPIVAG